MKYLYCDFNFWKNCSDIVKNSYLFLATSFTIPKYFTGLIFEPFVPSKTLFFDAVKDFENSQYEKRYQAQIFSLDKLYIKSLLCDMACRNKKNDIVFLVWEPENKSSERDIFIPWLNDLENPQDIKNFSFITYLKDKENNSILFEI